ncbi:AfsR/SARP family transcriptional regulator [Streptomyces formicae]|uniref:Signal transduction response regulator / Disease resistance domain-containing protein n=1 Tax=Streptomyces formicae TaxID=1616117 RepID=A0A291QKG4_9ACTN|nr:BTAD domain-containing putative transcriptional regulator [Streptomyces formicae]ATL32017.1 Signal transduction response regulator / Disease resistance domain-containing protein [Streptomyces formicae]
MEFELLGELVVRDDAGRLVPIPGALQRALLAFLLLHAPSAVSGGRILSELWTGARAKDPTAALHTAVAKLRRALHPHAPGLIRTGPAGYRLDLAGHSFDVRRFEAELAAARGRGGSDRRAAALRDLLHRNPGPPLGGLPALPFVQQERDRLEALRLTALEHRAEAELDVVAHAGVVEHDGETAADAPALVEELRAAVHEDPDRERLRALLIQALHACGRQAEALEVYRVARADLRERLGIEPGPELRAAQRAVLAATPARTTALAPPSAAPAPSGSFDRRDRHAAHSDPDAYEPAADPHFIGRGEELRDLRRLLRNPGLVTVVGAAGLGKTRLALAAAAREERPGAEVWRVDLVPCAPGGVTAAVADAMEVATGGLGPRAARQRIRAVADRSAHPLIVLDNCEHVLGDAGEVAAELLAGCPGLRILATSRECLGVADETPYALRPMTGDDAARLFRTRLRRLSPGAAEAALDHEIGEVCAAVDRMPLGIELVAAKAATAPLDGIVGQLRARRGVLDTRLWSADARHGTLRSAVDWSYQLLSPDERAVLRAVSVFTGGFTPEAAEAVAGAAAPTTLARLAAKSLLVFVPSADRPTYRMLVSVRQYARASLAEHGEEPTVLRRHAHWVATLAERTARRMRTGGFRAAYAEMSAAAPEVTACLDWLQGGEGTDDADALLASRIATRLALHWAAAGRQAEGRERLARALKVTTPAAPWYAEALAWCGWLGVNIRQDHGDEELLRRALPAAEAAGDDAVVAFVGALALTVHVRQERLAEAREAADRTEGALDAYRHGWETGVWQLFHSELLVAEDRSRQALTAAVTARELLSGIDPHSAATALIMTGMAQERIGDRAAALRSWQGVHQELLLIGSEHEAAWVKALLGYAAAGDGDPARAESFARGMDAYAKETGEPYLQAKTATLRALVASARGDKDTAERLHLTAVSGYQEGRRPECAAHDLAVLGRLAAERGDTVLAHIRWEHALRAARLSGRAHAEILPLRGLTGLTGLGAEEAEAGPLRARLDDVLCAASPPRSTECPFHLAVPAATGPLRK